MPELPEVEVLVRHLRPLLKGKIIRGVTVHREKVIRPTTKNELKRALTNARFDSVERRAKFLVFGLTKSSALKKQPSKSGNANLPAGSRQHTILIGHLGMTGRMYLQPTKASLPRHVAVSLDLGGTRFVYEDTRYFGRMTTDSTMLAGLGPEPWSDEFTVDAFAKDLKRSSQAIKIKLLDQSLVAGVGNIYASEALFRAGVSPRKAARRLTSAQVARLHASIREVLQEAIDCGSTIPLDFAGDGKRDGLFYYGQSGDGSTFYEERLLVYDRAGESCGRCQTVIRRMVQAARSTYFCPNCQRG